jgi:hypothetical protein
VLVLVDCVRRCVRIIDNSVGHSNNIGK